jgi:hypothetical protein
VRNGGDLTSATFDGRIRLNRELLNALELIYMPIQYTRPMQKVITPALIQRLERCLAEFPELSDTVVTVGLTKAADGIAEAGNMIVRLNVRPRKPVSYFTIGHELTHLLQSRGLRIVPDGEVQCDVWTLARSALFLDDRPTYLCPHLWTRATWPHLGVRVRDLCVAAIELRKTNRRYLVWLHDQLEPALTNPGAG